MADVKVRKAVIRVDSKKIGEMYNATFSVESGDEPVVGAEGVVAFTEGSPMSKLVGKTYIPVSGMSKDLTKLTLKKQRSKVTFFAGGIEYIMEPAASTSFEIVSEAQSGRLDGTFTFSAGNPDTA